MRLTIVAVGQLKSGPERDLAARYCERIAGTGKSVGLTGLFLREIQESRARRPEDRKSEEARGLRASIPRGSGIIALDEGGKNLTSAGFVAEMTNLRDSSLRDLCFVIGGADGLDPLLRNDAAMTLSFGAMTLPHQIVRALVAEQIYRAISILSGHPYHRA